MISKFLTADYTLIQIQSMIQLKHKLKTFVFKWTVLKKKMYTLALVLQLDIYTVHKISQWKQFGLSSNAFDGFSNVSLLATICILSQ